MAEKIIITGGSGFIGSHLVNALSTREHEIVNLDLKPPFLSAQKRYWIACDIKNKQSLSTAFASFSPSRVIHLAAKANLRGEKVDDFPDNTIGTENVVSCVNATESVVLFVNTSTQYVVSPGIFPSDSNYLEPYTAYGESKAVAEQTVRQRCIRPWVILRPTNIWGPGHPFFPHELWRYLERRYYVHPGFQPNYKYYGYVENAVRQIITVALTQTPAAFQSKVWYVTDHAIDNVDWMNGFSIALSGKSVRRIPIRIWRGMAKAGDLLKPLGVRFPVNGDRFFRLTVNENIPEEMIVPQNNEEIVSLELGIKKSVAWYHAIQENTCRSG